MVGRAELVHTQDENRPYKIVFWRDEQELGEIPVSSLDAAIAVAEDLLAKLKEASR